jgi:arylsulfatase A-like enzyme
VGYATGQFGKNHLGDRNEHLPTVHGFDEFYGNLYHLNVSEQEEYRSYQQFANAYGAEEFKKKFGCRGIVHSFAADRDDPTEDPKFGRVGKQTVEDTGQLTMERMKDIDAQEFIPRALDFMKKAKDDDKPFFVWLNTSRMHLYTHLNDKWRYAAEKFTHDEDLHGSGMMQHDHDVGLVLDFLKENGLEDNTIVWYSTDNGPEHSSWPHGGTSPFRGEKMTTYESGVRVISMLRWPGVIKPNQTLVGIQAHQDMFTSLAAAAGVTNVAEKIEKEKKQYIDGVNNLDWWTGKAPESARHHFLYYYESRITAVRMGPWKIHLTTREDYYAELANRVLFFNVRSDPFESYDNKDSAGHMMQRMSWLFQPMSVLIEDHLKTLAKYRPVQGGASFDMSNVVSEFLEKTMTATAQ